MTSVHAPTYLDGLKSEMVGEWITTRRIGVGAFAAVYEAVDTKTRSKKVALKKMAKVHPQKRDGIIKEFRIQSQLNHPRIIKAKELIDRQSEISFVMEYMEGKNLYEYLTTESGDLGLPEKKAKMLFWQMVCAVAHCHNHNVAHRDIKLENFILNKSGTEIKLTDFGFCENFDPCTKLLHTICGSPLYLAPEILSKRRHDTTKADVWALGITLFGMLTKRMPFANERGHITLNSILGVDVSAIIPGWVSPEAVDLLTKMLHPSNSERISTQDLLLHPWVRSAKELYEASQPEPTESLLSNTRLRPEIELGYQSPNTRPYSQSSFSAFVQYKR